jgi:AraC-like DNA-binding protein
MKYYTIPPPGILAQYVRYFWVLEGAASAALPYVYRSMADGCAELMFHYQGRFHEINAEGLELAGFHSGIHGQSRHMRRFVTQEHFGIFGVYLYPYAIPGLLSLPASELSDQMPDMDTLLGNQGRILEEQVMMAATNEKRVALVSSFLVERFRKTKEEPGVFNAINYIIGRAGQTNVQELAGQCYLSTRQFERKFKHFSGFSPKLYVRITRFQAALGHYRYKNKSLTEIAYDCGYYDQSHFIHDFRAFSGHHPYAYFKGNAEGTDFRDME